MAKKKVVTAAKKILISFIQDRSGSMQSCWDETLNGFKKYVNDLKADQKKDNEVEYLFSLTTFDTQIETPYLGVPIDKVDVDILHKYGPRGSTALYDAVGKTLQTHDDDKSITFDKAIVIIVTDGQENASREWSKTALHAGIDERIKRGNWTFTYLGTQPETWADASSLGMGVGSSATYTASNAGATYATMAMASSKMARSPMRASKAFMSDNTTRSMRGAVGMSVQGDDDPLSNGIPFSGTLSGIPMPGNGGLTGGGGFVGGLPTLPPKRPTPPPMVPRASKPDGSRRWK